MVIMILHIDNRFFKGVYKIIIDYAIMVVRD